MTQKETKQQAISEALKYLTIEDRKRLLGFIFLLPIQWNQLINDSVKKLSAAQCDLVLQFMATMPRGFDEETGPKKT